LFSTLCFKDANVATQRHRTLINLRSAITDDYIKTVSTSYHVVSLIDAHVVTDVDRGGIGQGNYTRPRLKIVAPYYAHNGIRLPITEMRR